MSKGFVKVLDENTIKSITLSSFSKYQKDIQNNSVICEPIDVLKRDYLNFINYSFDSNFNLSVKSLISGEVWESECYAVGLGDTLLDLVLKYYSKNRYRISEYKELDVKEFLNRFLNENLKNEVFLFSRDHVEIYIDSLSERKSREICKNILNIMSSDDTVYMEKTNREKTVIRKSEKLNLKLSYDLDYLFRKNKIYLSEYRVILIDGFIDSVGEIHHLLHKANESKENYVIFCKGMRDDVKHTIMLNVERNTLNVYPVCLEINEENVNVLSDIASILNVEIVSSLKGDTISQAVKEDLKIRKDITLGKHGIILKPDIGNSIKIQKDYLEKKVSGMCDNNPNFSYIKKRIKDLTSNKVNIELSTKISNNDMIEIDGFLKFINHGKSGILMSKDIKAKKKIFSKNEIIVLDRKFKSIVKSISNLGCVIISDER